ncbi:MAG: zinc ribbon domain-containing protein [Nitrospira sp.]
MDLLQAARCEDLVYGQIKQLSVLGPFEQGIISTLKQSGAHLLEGARGVGKSMLLRLAEIEMDSEFRGAGKLAVYVNFKTSTLLEGVKAGERDGFQVWVNAKILQALHEKLVSLDLIGHGGDADPYHRIFGIRSVESTKSFLQEKIHQLQKLAFSSDKEKVLQELGVEFLDRVLDTGFLVEMVNEVKTQFSLDKVIFLFDEAAHTFIPTQQEIFFEIFKLLHGGPISAKAAVYPSVTSYGRNFELGQDAIVLSMDRFEPGNRGKTVNRQLFRGIIDKRIPERNPLRKRIFSKGELLDLCIDLSTGNPRAFLHLLNRALDGGFSERAVTLASQDFVDKELLPYHQNLAKRLPKYAPHVRIGLDLLRGYIIPEIRSKNHRLTKSEYQSAFFTVQRDISPNVKLALDILCYSGVLVNKGTVKIADRQTGLRYMIHLALLATEKAFSSAKLSEALGAISLTDYREFSSTDPQIETYHKALKDSQDLCSECSAPLAPNVKFCGECGTRVHSTKIIGGLLDEPVSCLSISDKLRIRVEPSFPLVGNIVQAAREEIMRIPYIKEVRSRIIKNAADEFISG